MTTNTRLGILDWGIGGISVLKALKGIRPDISATYFSDTGAVPYGKMSRAELVSRLNSVIAYLAGLGVTHLAVGCNAASTAIPYLGENDVAIEGVIEPAVTLAVAAKPERLGLIGGRRTVLSGVYRDAFAEHGICVRQRIAQPLSAMIEAGDVSSPRLRDECRQILVPIRNCSHILLACTHYPAIADVVKEIVSSQTMLLDPAVSLARRVSKWPITAGGKDLFLTTGNTEQMRGSALKAFGFKVEKVKFVSKDHFQ